MREIKPMDWSDADVLGALQDQSLPLNKARAQFSFARARIEQACGQRRKPTGTELRRMEFEAVVRIIAAYNGEPIKD